jgi:chorismate mutase
VAVLETHLNKENIRNGFFELDWNNAFIEELITAGYKGETNEEIVEGWFREVTRNVLQEQGQDATRGAGYINVNKLGKDRSEIS